VQIDTLNGIPLHDVMQLNVGNCSDLLEKIRVQVLNTPIAVPYSAMILSHFAAEVIKIDLACASPRSTVPRLGDGTKAVPAHVRTLASGDHL